MRHGSLFSGIGGFDLAAQWMGWNNIFHCEWMPFPRKVLHHYWPEAISYEDITKTDFTVHHGQIDILTGGFPCQPYSAAGKRKGKDDDRHLWPHMLRAIREIRPRWIVGENVFGLTTWNGGVVFEEVCVELEAEGYSVQPFVLPAAAVGAPHRRDRVWFVAYRNMHGLNQCDGNNEFYASQGRVNAQRDVEQSDGDGHASDAESVRFGSWEQKSECTGAECEQKGSSIWGSTSTIGEKWDASNTTSKRLQGRYWSESSTGDSARLCPENNWQYFPTVAPICGGDDGISRELDGITFPKWRAESIKGYGNAIVPQVAMQIFKTIAQFEEM